MTKDELVTRVLERLESTPNDPYWSRRLCELLPFLDDAGNHEDAMISAIATLAAHDLDNILSENCLGLGMQLGLHVLSDEGCRKLEAKVRLEPAELQSYVRAKLWLAGDIGPQRSSLRHQRASELLKIAIGHYDTEDFYECLTLAFSKARYDDLKAIAATLLEKVPPFVGDVAVLILQAAARAEDWPTYDEYRLRYSERKSRRPMSMPHEDCAVLNLDGLRALAAGRMDIVRETMTTLMQRGQNVEFLGAPETTLLPNALRARGILVDEANQYLALTRQDE